MDQKQQSSQHAARHDLPFTRPELVHLTNIPPSTGLVQILGEGRSRKSFLADR
jgi:hypothetical protein